jgi:hypothetical protein
VSSRDKIRVAAAEEGWKRTLHITDDRFTRNDGTYIQVNYDKRGGVYSAWTGHINSKPWQFLTHQNCPGVIAALSERIRV